LSVFLGWNVGILGGGFMNTEYRRDLRSLKKKTHIKGGWRLPWLDRKEITASFSTWKI
jgi:hypothetical protein